MWLKLGSMVLVGMWLVSCAGEDEAQEPVSKSTETQGIPDTPGQAGEGEAKPAGDTQADVSATDEKAGDKSAEATPDRAGAGETLFVQPSHLNVRKGPGMDFEVARVITGGTEVKVLERKRVWARIGQDEWVSSTFLTETAPEPQANR